MSQTQTSNTIMITPHVSASVIKSSDKLASDCNAEENTREIIGISINFILTDDPESDIQKYLDKNIDSEKIYRIEIEEFPENITRNFLNGINEYAFRFAYEDYIKPASEKLGLNPQDIKIGTVDYDFHDLNE